MLNYKEIENRIKSATGLSKSQEIAALFGLTPNNYSNKKSIGSLLPVIIEWAIPKGINLDWLIKGNPVYSSEPAEKDMVYERREDYQEETSREIIGTIRDLDDEARRDVLKYAKEKKLLGEIKKGKRG